MQLSLFDIPQKELPEIELEELRSIELVEIFEAYFNCRSNKQNNANALAFEIDIEHNLVQLCEEINKGTYQIVRSIAFFVDKPVKRAILVTEQCIILSLINSTICLKKNLLMIVIVVE